MSKKEVNFNEFNLQGILLDLCQSIKRLSETEISDNGLEFFSKDYLSLYFEAHRLRNDIDDFTFMFKKGNV